MDTQMKHLASARSSTMRRDAEARRVAANHSPACRRWLLGVIPVSQPCPA